MLWRASTAWHECVLCPRCRSEVHRRRGLRLWISAGSAAEEGRLLRVGLGQPEAWWTVIPSSVNTCCTEHRQLPDVGALIVADEIRVAVLASQLEVPVVARQPRVEHFRNGDAPAAEDQRAWRLLAAMRDREVSPATHCAQVPH